MTSPFTKDCLKGKCALVTGGGSGIGYEITHQLGLHGAKVVIMGRRQKFLQEAVDSLKAEGITAALFVGDVRSRESALNAVSFTVQTYGALHILVNGAAGNFLANAHELSVKGFKTVLDIDTVGVFNMSTAAFPALKEAAAAAGSGGGDTSVVLNISATLHYGATWYQVHASAAKAAIDSLTRTLALEWGRHGIRTVGIAPGPIANTPGMSKLGPGIAGGQLDAFARSRVPLGRLGSTQDIAHAAVYLCCSSAGYVSGHTLVVDGGEYLHKEALAPPEAVSAMSRAVEASSRAMKPSSML